MVRSDSFLRCLLVLPCLGGGVLAAPGFDSGWMAPAAGALTDGLAQEVGWLRIQSNAMAQAKVPGASSDAAAVAAQRTALAELKRQGWRLAVMVRWGADYWSAARPGVGGGNRAPLDLREAYARGRELAATYGDLVDAWEIENEPDILFFADNADVFAAYHKALSLGLAAGRRPNPGSTPGEEGSLRLRGAETGGGATERQSDGEQRPEDRRQRLEAGMVELDRRGLRNPKVRTGVARGAWGEERRAESKESDARGAERGARSEELGAGSLGLGADSGERPGAGGASGAGSVECLNFTFPLNLSTSERPRSLVLMAAPGLPPGPHFEQLLANGYLSYTEGFNFHYYGFAMDFGGVYSQFHDAVGEPGEERGAGSGETDGKIKKEGGAGLEAVRRGRRIYTVAGLGSPPTAPRSHIHIPGSMLLAPRSTFLAPGFPASGSSLLAPRSLPVFITEWGYSLLDGVEAQTVPGRVAQWRYFADVAGQIEALGVAAPMAFLLRPYYEHGMKEFGLSMPTAEGRSRHYGFSVESPQKGAEGAKTSGEQFNAAQSVAAAASQSSGRLESFSAGGLSFTPQDFGAADVEPWMLRIGSRVGDAEASPALAWLLEQGAGSGERSAGGKEQGAGSRDQRQETRDQRTENRSQRPDTRDRRAADRDHRPEARGRRTADRGRMPATYDEQTDQGTSVTGIHDSKFLIPNSLPWLVRTEAPSPVVLDFIAGEDVSASKSFQGYVLGGMLRHESEPGAAARPVREGEGTLVFYNFGPEPATVKVHWPEGMRPDDEGQRPETRGQRTEDGGQGTEDGGREAEVGRPAPDADGRLYHLAPGERREVSVRLRCQASVFRPSEVRIEAEVRGGGTKEATVSRWASRFYPLPSGMAATRVRRLDFSADVTAANRERLQTRPLAPEEPALREDGRWLVTEGVRVEETSEGWRFHIDHLPGVGLRPAVAELPLPEGWRMAEGETLAYEYRLIDGPGVAPLRADDPDPRRRLQTGRAGAISESYIRTETGNLFSTTPRLSPTGEWKRYTQNAENLTMHFLGRTAPPWRFFEHRPAALVFFVRPDRLPAIYEVRNPLVATMASPF